MADLRSVGPEISNCVAVAVFFLRIKYFTSDHRIGAWCYELIESQDDEWEPVIPGFFVQMKDWEANALDSEVDTSSSMWTKVRAWPSDRKAFHGFCEAGVGTELKFVVSKRKI